MHEGHHVFAHLPHLHFFELPEEVAHFYALAFIRTVLTVTGGLFLPLYIYKATGSLFLVFLYMLLSQSFAKLPLRPLNLWILRRFGIEWAMFASIILAGIEYLLVYFFGTALLPVFFYGVLEGISASLYWDSYHTSFGLFGKLKESAEELAGLQIIQSMTTILLPFLSAVVISVLGFHVFYAIVFISTVIASLWLLSRFGATHKVNFTMREVLTVPYRALHLSDGAQYGFTWIIPIFLYIVLNGSVLLFGVVKTIIAASMALFSFVIARYFDRKRAFGLGKIVYAGNAVFPTILATFPSPVVATVTETARGLTNTFGVAITATLYRVVRDRSPALAVGRSFYVSAGKSVAFTAALVLSYLVERAHVLSLSPVDLTRYLIYGAAIFALTSIYLYGRLERDVESLGA